MVLARWPAPGRCKRRLAAGLGAAAAARIQARLSAHALAEARAACRLMAPEAAALQVVLAVGGLGPAAARRWGQGLGAPRTVLQGRGGLGLRLARQVARAERERASAVLLIGSDLPALAAADLAAAGSALAPGGCGRAPHRLVLGPALDGGYWLLGLALPGSAARGPAAGPGPGAALRFWTPLLAGIPWGSDAVLAATEAAAAAAGLSAWRLGPRADLDHPADLAPWRQRRWA